MGNIFYLSLIPFYSSLNNTVVDTRNHFKQQNGWDTLKPDLYFYLVRMFPIRHNHIVYLKAYFAIMPIVFNLSPICLALLVSCVVFTFIVTMQICFGTCESFKFVKKQLSN